MRCVFALCDWPLPNANGNMTHEWMVTKLPLLRQNEAKYQFIAWIKREEKSERFDVEFNDCAQFSVHRNGYFAPGAYVMHKNQNETYYFFCFTIFVYRKTIGILLIIRLSECYKFSWFNATNARAGTYVSNRHPHIDTSTHDTLRIALHRLVVYVCTGACSGKHKLKNDMYINSWPCLSLCVNNK